MVYLFVGGMLRRVEGWVICRAYVVPGDAKAALQWST
jgi:hypothetical protein